MPVRLLQYILKFISDAFLERAVSAATPIPLCGPRLPWTRTLARVCTGTCTGPGTGRVRSDPWGPPGSDSRPQAYCDCPRCHLARESRVGLTSAHRHNGRGLPVRASWVTVTVQVGPTRSQLRVFRSRSASESRSDNSPATTHDHAPPNGVVQMGCHRDRHRDGDFNSGPRRAAGRRPGGRVAFGNLNPRGFHLTPTPPALQGPRGAGVHSLGLPVLLKSATTSSTVPSDASR